MKILLLPDHPHFKWKITKLKVIFETAGIEVTNNINDSFDLAIYWSYHKIYKKHDEYIGLLHEKNKILNFGCNDISKSFVEKIMKKAFGYNAIVNPKHFKPYGEKSEAQGSHSIIEKDSFEGYKPNHIYVKLLDGRINDKTTRDYRIYVFGDKIPLVVTKDKPLEYKYAGANHATLVAYKNPLDVFSEEEVFKIIRFCKLYPIDFTELDAMRDSDGKLYIVDNNNVSAFSEKEQELFYNNNIISYLSNEFLNFLNNAYSRSSSF